MQALEKNHDYIPTVKALAELYWKQNNYDMGLLHYQTLAKLDPSVDYGKPILIPVTFELVPRQPCFLFF
jgi:hypothetical protein